MPLGLTVTLLVLGGIVLAGLAGYLIEKSPEAADLPDANQPDAHQEQRQSR
jgi:hypothetical protein